MRALTYHRDGRLLKIEDVAKPRPKADDVLVQVKAASIARSELEAPATKGNDVVVPGHGVAGIIEAVGDAVSGFQPGDEVFALTASHRNGAVSEYTLVSSSELAIKPPCLSFEETASIPFSALTAYQALFTHADTQPGQKVLITGAGGGVGGMAVQIAAAAQLLVTALCPCRQTDRVKELGAHEVFDPRHTPLHSLSHAYDLVLDCEGGGTLGQCFKLLKGRGQLVCTARPATADEKAQRPDVGASYCVAEPDAEELTRIAQCVEHDVIRPVPHTVLSLERGMEALDAMLEKETADGTHEIVVTMDARVDSPTLGG